MMSALENGNSMVVGIEGSEWLGDLGGNSARQCASYTDDRNFSFFLPLSSDLRVSPLRDYLSPINHDQPR